MNALIALRLVNRNNLGMKRMYRAMLSDGKEPPIIKDVGESVRVVFLASEYSVAFRAFVERQGLEGRLLSLEHLLILQYVLRHGEIDLSTSASICQQTEREAREILRQLVVAEILIMERRNQVNYWLLHNATARSLHTDKHDEKPLTKFGVAQGRVIALLENRVGGIKAPEIRSATGLNAEEAKYLMRTMKERNIVKSNGKGPRAIWELVGDSVGGAPLLSSPSAAAGDESGGTPPELSPTVKQQTPAKTQRRKFVAAAKEIGCDEDEGAFKERLKKLTPAPPPKSVQKRMTKKTDKPTQ